MEMDSHADTTVLGKNCVILSYTGRECDVAPYSDQYEPLNGIPVVTGATAWTSPETGETQILVFHEALWFGDRLDHSLINPNQVRHFGVTLDDNPFVGDMGIKFDPDDDAIDIPFSSMGTTIYFDSRTPTESELQTCPKVYLTSKTEWDPRSVKFPGGRPRIEEGDIGNSISKVSLSAIRRHQVRSIQDGTAPEVGVAGTIYDPVEFSARLISKIRVSSINQDEYTMDDLPDRRTFYSKERKTSVDPRDLAERWGISLAKAIQTLKATTQRIVRSAVLPLARRYRADRMFERPRIRGMMYSDTLDGKYKSLDGNRYAQVFANESFFVASYPIPTKGYAGDAFEDVY